MGSTEIFGIDRRKNVVGRTGNSTFINPIGNPIEQVVLFDHVRRLKHRTREHELPDEGGRFHFHLALSEWLIVFDDRNVLALGPNQVGDGFPMGVRVFLLKTAM